MMLILTSLLALQAAPAPAGEDIVVTYDCGVLRSRQEVRCEVDMAVPPSAVAQGSRTNVQYECLYSAHRLTGRCIVRSPLPDDVRVRARVEELAQSAETASWFFQMFNMPGGPEMKITTRVPLVPTEASDGET
jgi:hypothetical protein